MSGILARRRITAGLQANAHISRAWSKGLAASTPRAFRSSSKPMGSTGLSHAPSPETSPEFIYDRSSKNNSGTPFSDRTIPAIEVPISKPAPPKVPILSPPEQDALPEAQVQNKHTTTAPILQQDTVPDAEMQSKHTAAVPLEQNALPDAQVQNKHAVAMPTTSTSEQDAVADVQAQDKQVAAAPVASTIEQDALPEAQTQTQHVATVPAYHRGSKYDRLPYWQKIKRWKDVDEKKFLSYSWNTANDIKGEKRLLMFMKEVLPERMPNTIEYEHIRTKDDFILDFIAGITLAPMSIRLTPHILASIDWNDPLRDPLSQQFIPKRSKMQPNHPRMELDSLHEVRDSPVDGLVHRYTDKCLFLAQSLCPLYCRFCTRAWTVGRDTDTITKCTLKAGYARWDVMLEYIAATPVIEDVVISGGDSYSLDPHHLDYIGSRLLDIPHIRRFRVATKGLCAHPSRTLDPKDYWTDVMIKLSNEGKLRGKEVALHTHFNHPNEISWVTREAAQKLYTNGVFVRNQTVLLRGVNDDVDTMGSLIRELADIKYRPYYVYACDMTPGIEEFRTPLSTLLHLEQQLRGTIGGFEFPNFIVDLPGGGGKRLAASYETYDRTTGRSTFIAPAVRGKGKKDKVYEYFDPLFSLPNSGKGVDLDGTQDGVNRAVNRVADFFSL